jgi:hypothetical protein
VKSPIAGKLNALASTLETLKSRVREAMAGEMAKAVGEAVRDVLIVVLCDQFAAASSPYRSSGTASWHAERERDEWEEDDYPRNDWREAVRTAVPPVPTAAAVAVGVQVGRWCFRRYGVLPLSLGAGALATVIGLSGGVATRAVLAVLSAGVDLLTADSDLAR